MISNRQRILARLDRIPTSELRDLINECIAIASMNPSSSQVPRRKYREAITKSAERHGPAPSDSYTRLSDEEIQRAARQGPTNTNSGGHVLSDEVSFERLELVNFGSFYGQHEVELRAVGGRRVSVFVGDNGTGKSTTFTAINWTLFGDIVLGDGSHTRGAPKAKLELVNTRCIEEAMTSGKLIETRSTIGFRSAGENYRITRKFTTHFLDDLASPGETSVTIHRIEQTGNYTDLSEGDLASILRVIPAGVREFYLFDGDRINQFTASDSHARIRGAIKSIVGMDRLHEVVSSLRTTESDIRSAQNKANPNGALGDALRERDRLEENIDRATAAIRRSTEDRLTLEANVQEIDRRLAETATASGLQARRAELQTEQKVNVARIAESLSDVRAHLANTFESLAIPALEELRFDLETVHSTGKLVGGLHPEYLADLLAHEVCICGRPVSEHEPAAKAHLQKLLEDLRDASTIEGRVLNIFYELPTLIKDLRRRPASLADKFRQYSIAWENDQAIRGNLDLLSGQIAGLDEVDQAGWEAERIDLKAQIDKQVAQIAREQLSLEDSRAAKNTLTSKIEQLTGEEGKAEVLAREHGWAIAALGAMEAIVEEFSAIARLEAAHRTQALWNQLLPNVSSYKVSIDRDYGIDVRNEVGDKGLTQLSAGQRQCLGLAFITSIAHVSETLPPLIIDVPFSKLSADVAAEVASSLPALTSQLILFLLPGTEWNETTQLALAHDIGKTIYLVQDESQGSHFELKG